MHRPCGMAHCKELQIGEFTLTNRTPQLKCAGPTDFFTIRLIKILQKFVMQTLGVGCPRTKQLLTS